MSYEFPDDPKATFAERTPQFVGLGFPKEEVDRLAAAITDMWADAPGGWCYEWSQLAERYIDSGETWMAALAYGNARFPVLADDAKKAAMGHQLEQYIASSKDFPGRLRASGGHHPFPGQGGRVTGSCAEREGRDRTTRRSFCSVEAWTPGRWTSTRCGSTTYRAHMSA